LKEKKGKEKEPYPAGAGEESRCREGGSTAGSSVRREHISRRETEKRGFEWGAAEER